MITIFAEIEYISNDTSLLGSMLVRFTKGLTLFIEYKSFMLLFPSSPRTPLVCKFHMCFNLAQGFNQ